MSGGVGWACREEEGEKPVVLPESLERSQREGGKQQ